MRRISGRETHRNVGCTYQMADILVQWQILFLYAILGASMPTNCENEWICSGGKTYWLCNKVSMKSTDDATINPLYHILLLTFSWFHMVLVWKVGSKFIHQESSYTQDSSHELIRKTSSLSRQYIKQYSRKLHVKYIYSRFTIERKYLYTFRYVVNIRPGDAMTFERMLSLISAS